MEKVPYALKIETSESCLTLSARYGVGVGGALTVNVRRVGGRRVWGRRGRSLKVRKFGITVAGCVVIFPLMSF